MALPIAVIGAGLAGISAARALIAHGHAVTIFDQGRGPGGRLATRRIEAEGRKPHWRFVLPNFKDDPFHTIRTEARWDDLVRGPQGALLLMEAELIEPFLYPLQGPELGPRLLAGIRRLTASAPATRR